MTRADSWKVSNYATCGWICMLQVEFESDLASEEGETESHQEHGRWLGHQRSGGRVLKADGSIGDGSRAGTGDPDSDCPWATPLERSCSPGWTVGECARQAQSGARASCCTRSWVLRGLGSCRRLPSPQNTEQQCSGKVTGIRARHITDQSS